MNNRLDTALSVILVLAGVVAAAAAVRRDHTPTVVRDQPPTYIDDWRAAFQSGRIAGDPNAPVVLIEFTDLECPFCRRFNRTVRALQSRYGSRLAYVFVHRPLAMHRFAQPAALAAECAANQGRFFEVIDLLLEKQDSLGLKPWSAYALDAGIRDTVSYEKCLKDASIRPAVRNGLALAGKLEVNGTPTIMLNGWRFVRPPPDSELVHAIGELLAGRTPYNRVPKS